MNLEIDRRLVATELPTGPAEGPENVEKSSVGDPSDGLELGSSDDNRRQAETLCAIETDDQEFSLEPDDQSSVAPHAFILPPQSSALTCNDIPCELSLKDASGRYKQVSFKDILDFFRLPRDQEISFGNDSDIFSNLFTAKRHFEQSYPAAGIAGRLSQTGSGKISDDIKFLKNLKKPDMRDEYVWLNLRKFIQQIFGDSVYTGWGSSFQELDDLLPENTPKDPDAKFVSIPSNSLEFLDATIDFLIELLKDRQAILKKSERSTQVKAAKVTVTTLLASLLAGIFSGVVADKQPNQVQVAETPSEPGRTRQVSMSRPENAQLLTLGDIKNISSEDDLMALNGRAILLGELTDYEFAKTLKDKPGWKEFEGKPGIIQGVIGDDVDFSDPKNVYAAVISGAANLKSLQDHIKKETKPITPKTLFIFTNRPSDRDRPVRIPFIPEADCYPIVTKQVNSDGSISFNFHIPEINERARYTKEKQRIVLEPVFNPYASQENFI